MEKNKVDDLKQDSSKKQGNGSFHMRYISMAYEIFGLLLFAGILGHYLDKYFATPKPYWTAGLLLFFLITWFIKLYYTLEYKEEEQ